MIAAILGLLKSLPEIISLLKEVWSYINKISGNDPAGFIVKVGVAFNQLNAAQTKEDYEAVAKILADTIAHIPPK